jgi:hypothetical protein
MTTVPPVSRRDPETAPDAGPVRKSAQRLRWFLSSFADQVRRTEAETGVTFRCDQDALTAAFAEWLQDFQVQKPAELGEKASYVGFAAGLMLRTLVRRAPVVATAKPADADDSHPAYFWPEGYLYVAFCLNVRGLVLEHDFHDPQHPGAELGDPRVWWSFRENVSRDPSLAIAFLDLFAGDEPDWTMPDLFRKGKAREIAGRFYAMELEPPVPD